MKTFSKFLSEASSIQQAKAMGLVSDGHGGWYDRRGEFIAKTFGDELKFYNKRQRVGLRDPNQTERERRIPSSLYNDPEKVQPQVIQQPEPTPQELPPDQQMMGQEEVPQQFVPYPVPKTKGSLTVAFGRFNPPTIGHLQLMDVAASAAEQDGGDYLIYPSRSIDQNKNPLDPDTKIYFMRRMFPQHGERVVNDPNIVTIFDVLKRAYTDGYSSVRIVSGSDRVKEFEKHANTYNGQLYDFDNIEVISSGDVDPDSKGVNGITASRMRLAAAEGDFRKFKEGLPPDVKRADAIELFDILRSSMNIQEKCETWKIAPKLDFTTLRENYLLESIFKNGDLVENMNTGVVGKIIRRGTNYLICVTESGMMFKSWIKDLNEYTEVRMDSPMRDDIHPNTLVGTLGAFRHAVSMTPGAVGTGAENLQIGGVPYGIEFINKYRKSKK